MLAQRFCYGTDAQRNALRTLNIPTMEDLLIATRLDVYCNLRHEHNPPVLNVHVPVFKKHLIGFMKHKCRGLFVDFDKLLDENVVVTGGSYPQQWYAIHPGHVTKPAAALAPSPSSRPRHRRRHRSRSHQRVCTTSTGP
jgi:hypothetical protein